jgi:hypothetical protein
VTLEANEAPLSRYVPPSKERLAALAEERAERRREGAARSRKPSLKPTDGKPDFGIQTMEGASWSEGSRYMVWTLPTASMSAGGMPFAPSKRQARVSSV